MAKPTRVLSADEMQPHLPQAEQVEVVDKTCHHEHLQPSARENRPDERPHERLLNAPHGAAKRAPLPEQQIEGKAREEHVRRSLDAHGTTCVHQFLNQRRAMTLCWTANTASRSASTASAVENGDVAGPSSCVGTANPPTKAIA